MKHFLPAVIVGLLVSLSQAQVKLPASAETAQERLTSSTRHGEFVTITPNAETKIKAWISYPERKDKAPVVIVIHEIFGLTDWVRAVADQLAAEGFIAVAPDMLSGKGEGGGGTETFKGDTVREAIRRLPADEVAMTLNAARQYALDQPSAGPKTACIGFCWGGTQSFNYASRQPALNAAIVYYGSATQDADLSRITCPVVGFYGGDDARVTSTVEPTKKLMQEKEKSYTTHVYDGAGHGFLRQQRERNGANEKAANQAWTETIKVLKEKLQ